VAAIRDVVSSSYDRILIDEYQDCDVLQHELATTLATIVPTVIFGDPMQGIFEFAGATLSWAGHIHLQFPLAGSLDIPYRWQGKNPELGAWIAETRQRLMIGEPIDLESGPIIYRSSNNAFDMGTFFDGIDAREGTQAAIHCNRAICNRLAQATRGGFQAIEEMAASRLQSFATDWDSSTDQSRRLAVVKELIKDCFHIKQRLPDEDEDQEDDALGHEMNIIAHNLGGSDGIIAAQQLFSLARRRSRWRLFRGEIWRDGEKAMSEIESDRASTMMDATAIIRQRITNSGRRLPTRTISTPLLLKGLEFDHVVIPDATHFCGERFAHAKLFYVAISRATRSLTISSSERFLQFPVPKI
jgi:DNA helicase-2/ATP-dependent DNA helicase PcrA